VPISPEIGVFGGGLVVPVVRLTLDGLLFVPIVQFEPSIGLSSLTFTGSLIVVTGMPNLISRVKLGRAKSKGP